MRRRLIAASAVMAATVALAIAPTTAQASTVAPASAQAGQVATATTHSAIPAFEVTVFRGHFATNAKCAAAGAEYLQQGAFSFHCDRHMGGGWDLYVVYLIK